MIREQGPVRSKLPQVGTTIFTVMSNKAKEYGAINLSQGFPDFDCPERLRELVSYYLNDKRNQYPPMTGVPELREQIASKLDDLYGHKADPEHEITVTSGATEALFDAIIAFSGIGDEVIVFDPAYDSYCPSIQVAGARAIRLPLSLPDYGIDWNQVKDHLSDRTRLIIINSPHNPTGAVLSSADLDSLAELIRGRDILVLSDEVYEHMVFDGGAHQSVLRHPELREQSLAVFSFGKTYHATGWKLAYCVAPQELTAEFRKMHQFVTFTSPGFIQYAIADFMQECPEHHLDLADFYQVKRDTFCRLMKDSRFKLTPSKGTYFQLLDYGEINQLDDNEFADYLVREKGIASIPLSPFYGRQDETGTERHNGSAPRHLRFCFCKEDATLQAAADILCSL